MSTRKSSSINFSITKLSIVFLICFLICAANLFADTRYVNVNNPSPVSPYDTWAKAATNIQDAVDAAVSGDTVLVTNGTYASGGAATPGYTLQNRVVVTNAITLQSVNGPESTIIVGNGPQGNDAVRCAYLEDNVVMLGFTLSNGHTLTTGSSRDRLAGGLLVIGTAFVSNCVIRECDAIYNGGGVYLYGSATLHSCIVTNNWAYKFGDDLRGGGVYMASGGLLTNCTIIGNSAKLGGGVYMNSGGTVAGSIISDNEGGGLFLQSGNTVNDCTISRNEASYGAGLMAVNGCTVNNCMIVGNSAKNDSGGAYIGTASVLNNSFISMNSAGNQGGGIVLEGNGKANNCFISENSAEDGGGVRLMNVNSILNSCTVVRNSASESAGGVYCYGPGKVRNSIVYDNTAITDDNYSYNSTPGSYTYCCITPDPGGEGNIVNNPLLAGFDNPHIVSNSPCINAGTNAFAVGTDIDGETRIYDSVVDIGCDEYVSPGITGTLHVSIITRCTNAVPGFSVPFTSGIRGKASRFGWDFGEGETNGNEITTYYSWSAPGDYPVILIAYNSDYPGGAAETITVHITTISTNYVSLSGSHVPPFSSWENAAINIQEAVDASVCGGFVLVADGVYDLNGRTNDDLFCRVSIDKPVTVCSVNGPDNALILGAGPIGDYAVRCAYLFDGAKLYGFTLTNGYTKDSGNDGTKGGGAFLNKGSSMSNCVICVNEAAYRGAGIFLNGGGQVDDCTISGNSAYDNGGGAYLYYGGTINRCNVSGNSGRNGAGVHLEKGGTVSKSKISGNVAQGSNGGGLYCNEGGTVNRCIISGNSASQGGGVYCRNDGTVNNSLIITNTAGNVGGVYCYNGGTVNNCTITSNSAEYTTGGIRCNNGGEVRNSIIYFNNAPSDTNYTYSGSGVSFEYCSMTPDPGVVGTMVITNDPMFINVAGANYHLQPYSPCVNAGTNAYAVGDYDLDGLPRINDGTVDMGAYEFNTSSFIHVSVDALDFGDVILDDTNELWLAIENRGGGILNGEAMNVIPPFELVSGSPYAIEPWNFTTVVFRFMPTALGTESNQVTLTGGGDATVLLTGTGIPEPTFIWIMTVFCALLRKHNTLLR